MAIRVALNHKTTYHYDRLVTLSPQVIRLRPAPHCRTPVTAYSLKIEPKGYFLNWQQDPQSNYLARAVFPNMVDHFSVEVDLVAEMTVINPFDFFLEPFAETFPFSYPDSQRSELRPYLDAPPPGPRLQSYLRKIDRSPRRSIDFLVYLNQSLHNDIAYVVRMEPGVQSPDETLERRNGSCRDSAWMMVQILRKMGLAARFVSGYLIQLKADVKSLDGPPGTAVDFTDLHAWAEVYLPGGGWIGLDATSGLFAGEGHLPLAATPEPLSAAPVTGGVSISQVQFSHHMSVTRIHEDPRVTLPYTDHQWSRIEALGHQIDAEIVSGDVRLTVGGEPTFVSIDNMDGAEWNTLALGKEKRQLAERLVDRLRDRFAAGGVLHSGQGKWYPGEQLPRWAMICYWRKDGVPLWRDRSLLAREDASQGYGEPEAMKFAGALASRLGVGPEYAVPAYEDPLYYLQRERQLPLNVSQVESKVEDPQEQERLRLVFTRGLNTPVGYVLPIQRGEGKDGPEWQTGLWRLRGHHLLLTPGDSPVGLRLPLASLPWIAEKDIPFAPPKDPMEQRPPLPSPPTRRPAIGPQITHAPQAAAQALRDRMPASGESAVWVVRTALCVEPRDGRLYLFLPPVTSAEDYVDLVEAIEDTAAELQMPIVMEGYTPPHDPRIEHIKVTPDPGVIEVNTQPVSTWQELVANTTVLYEDARLSRLGTEKFMLDGRHTGTGGGNHFVLGGPTAGDSPFLRRPDLLCSLIGYWLNHPSLSYLFSGMFIGPTSQAPRVDETRADSIYELEIAFRQIPDPGAGEVPPWLVDRIFRHILVDVSGNTHRAEFCIDKLYSPDSSTGRLGLLELRGFEMPPHARMSLTQQLLVRALVAWFWRQPHKHAPVAWGTRLHDEFMLPYFTERDFAGVISDLNEAGYAFQREWFAPHFEFRYPVFGRAHHLGIDIEIRQATEPWYVLGEEPAGGGTSRFVDSSVERVQVKVNGLINSRYVVTCNRRRVPLQGTGTQGEFAGGVRYRAWQPPSCLHPTIPVHTPLIFDIVDTWVGRSVGGCSYHVAHPGGRSYETFPVNANEAEARRTARFFAFGHTPGPMETPAVEENPQFPLTLDLRR